MAKNETMDFSAFMAGSAIAAEPVEYVASKRFKGKDGEPAKWKIQPFSWGRSFGDHSSSLGF